MVGVGALLAWQLAEAHHGDAGLRFSALAMGVVVLGTAFFSWWRADMRRRALFVALLAAWIVPPLFALEGLRQAHGLAGLVLLLVASKVGDTFGYYVGGAIGKRHPFPRLSPGKTVAGCVASLAGCVAVVVALHLAGLAPEARHGTAGVALAAVAINLAAQAGDLLESHAKRKAGVKDSSGWFGPSGGLFDQVDSLLLTVPMAVVCWPLAFHAAA
jgi:phosphatidate cytidylyltransferase